MGMNTEPVAWMLTDRVVSSVPIEGAIPLYTHPADTEKVKENMDKALKQNERLIEALANARITFNAEIEKKNTMLKMWEATHPAKTLTDEEILKEWTWKYLDCFEDFLLQFARAILKKASEK